VQRKGGRDEGSGYGYPEHRFLLLHRFFLRYDRARF
jgi:hypothetical protein